MKAKDFVTGTLEAVAKFAEKTQAACAACSELPSPAHFTISCMPAYNPMGKIIATGPTFSVRSVEWYRHDWIRVRKSTEGYDPDEIWFCRGCAEDKGLVAKKTVGKLP